MHAIKSIGARMTKQKARAERRPGDGIWIDEFCSRNGPTTRTTLYKLWREGKEPAWVQIGRRRLILLEDEAAWRAAHRRTTKRMTKPPSDEYRPPPSKNIAIG